MVSYPMLWVSVRWIHPNGKLENVCFSHLQHVQGWVSWATNHEDWFKAPLSQCCNRFPKDVHFIKLHMLSFEYSSCCMARPIHQHKLNLYLWKLLQINHFGFSIMILNWCILGTMVLLFLIVHQWLMICWGV